MLFAGIAAITTERLAFRPLRGADPATLLISSFAVSYLIQQIIRSIYGSEPKSVGVGEALNRTLTFLGVRTSIIDVVIIGVTAVLLGALAAFLSRTTMGLQVRAASEDFVMARLLGIRANRVISIAFFIGGALGGAVSVLYVIKTGGLEPTMGVNLVLFAFVAVILGGMGSLWGAVGGAYLLGMVSVALQVALPIGLRGARDAFLFFIIVIILRLRPHGLFRGVAAGERV
jgi:branched-chain amino acid transport system permease protein